MTSELGFSNIDDCLAFLLEVEAALDDDHKIMDCKLTAAKL